ncbi:MAG: WYL domain-containing protein [Propionicimonas sp.]
METGSNDPLFPDEVGYRIRRADFELPPIDFTPAEAAVLGLASRVWESATAAEPAISAIAKLRAASVDPDPARARGLSAALGGREPAFDALWQATVDHTPVQFDYRGELRQVEPWTMTYRRGSWYLLGYDRNRGGRRVFKVARAGAEITPIGRSGSYQVPEIDTAELLASLEPSGPMPPPCWRSAATGRRRCGAAANRWTPSCRLDSLPSGWSTPAGATWSGRSVPTART